MEELALNPLRRSRYKRQHSLLVEDDWDEVPLISDDDDDETASKNAHHRRWRNQSWSRHVFKWLFDGGWKTTGLE